MSENQQLTAIEMRGVDVVSTRDPGYVAVTGVNWSVLTGEFWVVAGQQQSGKSDLLMLTAGLMPAGAGSYKLFGNETKGLGEGELAERLRLGFVFQDGQLFNQMTIAENVALPLRYQKNLTAAEAAPEVGAMLDWMELTPLADVTPLNVAANWRQRAALARALILRPEILVLDNPQGGLQIRHLNWWLRFLDQLWRGHERLGGRPMTIVATADDLRPWRNADRKFAMLHDKKLVPLGSWGDVETAVDPAVKELLSVQSPALI